MAYFDNPAAPGLRFFSCGPFRATLSQGGCATRWRQAQDTKGKSRELVEASRPCRGCAIGAAHAGANHVPLSQWFGAAICSGCRTGSTRIIGRRLCPTCYNRRRTMRVGINRRGHKPVELLAKKSLRTVEFHLRVDGRERRVRVAGVADLLEPMVQFMRTERGLPAWGHAAPNHLIQGRLL